MKLECVKEKIATAISLAEKMTGKNATLPILSCVLLEARKNDLVIKSTNLDIGFEYVIPARVSSVGTIAVPGQVLCVFLNSLIGNNSVVMEENNGNLIIDTSDSKVVIKGHPMDDYPSIPKFSGEQIISIESQVLVKILKAVHFAVSNSNIRPELSSVLFSTDGDSVVCVATDSFRLAEKKIKIKKTKEISPILIPSKNVQDIIRVLENLSEEVELHINKNQIAVVFKNGYLVSRLIEGNFPDYKQIIPKEHKTEVIVLKRDFVNTLKLSVVFSDKFNQVTLSVKAKEKILEISSTNKDIGESSQKMTVSVSGDSVSLNFNYKYLMDCIQSIETDSLSLCFSGESKAVIISGVSDRSFTYLVMPLNR